MMILNNKFNKEYKCHVFYHMIIHHKEVKKIHIINKNKIYIMNIIINNKTYKINNHKMIVSSKISSKLLKQKIIQK